MSQPSNIAAYLYADEAAFGETSTTFDERPQVVGAIDTSGLTQEILDLGLTTQYVNEGHMGAKGPLGGSFEVTTYLAGHGSTSAGTITANTQETLLARAIGGINVAQAGTTLTSATSAVQWLPAGGTQVDGAVGFLGVVGDGDGNGQAFVADDETTFTSLIAMDDTPAGSAVMLAASNIYPIETAANDTLTSVRFQLLSGNQRYNCHGCYPTGITISGLNAGEIPQIAVTYGVARWAAENAATFPTVTAVDTDVPAIVSAGSLHMSAVGTTTRTKYCYRDLSVDIQLETKAIPGTCSGHTRQVIVDAKRVRCNAKIAFTVDAEAAGTETLGDIWDAEVFQQIMVTLSTEDGSAVALWFPNCRPVGPRPTQFDDNGINRIRIELEAHTSQDSTTALTHAAFIIAQG